MGTAVTHFSLLLVFALSVPSAGNAAVRDYFVAVEAPVSDTGRNWDYAPTGMDGLTGRSLDSSFPEDYDRGLVGMELMHQPATWTKRQQVRNMTYFRARLSTMNQNMGMQAGGMDPIATENTPRVGRVYKKATLVEYTDASFTTRRTRSAEEAHLAILGPTLRAEVGDTLRVTFRNAMDADAVEKGAGLKGLGFSLHPHGVLYERRHEGAPYVENSTLPRARRRQSDAQGQRRQNLPGVPTPYPGDNVPPGGQHVYEWFVPERAGPGPADGTSVAWFYHSHVIEPRDTNAALVGAIIVTKRGHGVVRDDGINGPRPNDVDRELVVLLSIIDENASPFALQNFLPLVDNDVSAYRYLSANQAFLDSNRMRTMNGRVFANLEGLYTFENARTRWYVGTLGGELDIHGAHWHGNTLLHESRRVDTVPLLPAVFTVADMVPDTLGQWLFHCHTNHHIHAGMTALYEVLPAPPPTATASSGSGSAAPTASSPTSSDGSRDAAAAAESTVAVSVVVAIFGLVGIAAALALLIHHRNQGKTHEASD